MGIGIFSFSCRVPDPFGAGAGNDDRIGEYNPRRIIAADESLLNLVFSEENSRLDVKVGAVLFNAGSQSHKYSAIVCR